MKIALVHCFLGGKAGGGGGVRQMLELGRALSDGGHEVVVCAQRFEPGSISPEPESEFEVRAVRRGPIDVPTSTPAYLRFSWLGTRELAKLIPRDVDVINIHEAPAHLAALGLGGVDAPIVWTRNDATLYEMALMPDEVWSADGGPVKRLARRALGLPDRVAANRMSAIAVLDSRNKRMVERAYGRSASVIQSGAAAKFFAAPTRSEARHRLGIPADQFVVLSVGISAPYRRHEDVIDAVAVLTKRRPDIDARARIVGSAHIFPDVGAMLRDKVAAEGLGDRVELIQEAVPDDELVAEFAACDVFVFPNELQTWGLAPLEAIAAGSPVVVSRGAGVHEVLEGREGVSLVEPRSPTQIADAVAAFADVPASRDVAETRAWISDEFGSGSYAKRMLELFASAAQRS